MNSLCVKDNDEDIVVTGGGGAYSQNKHVIDWIFVQDFLNAHKHDDAAEREPTRGKSESRASVCSSIETTISFFDQDTLDKLSGMDGVACLDPKEWNRIGRVLRYV